MISQLKPPEVKVLSLTTIATPHHGSAFADYIFHTIGRKNFSQGDAWLRLIQPAMQIPKIYKAMEAFGLETGAFSQLTRKYMDEKFNPKTPDVEGVKSDVSIRSHCTR